MFYGSVGQRRRRREHMRRRQLRARKRRTARIDMHSFHAATLYVVLHARAALMVGDVVFCSLPMVACSSFAARRVVCRYLRIMAYEMSPFCDASSDVVALLRARHAVHILHSRDMVRESQRRGEKYFVSEDVHVGTDDMLELGCSTRACSLTL